MFAARSTSLVTRRVASLVSTHPSTQYRSLRSTSKNVPPSSPTPETAPEPTLENSTSTPPPHATQGDPSLASPSPDIPPLSSDPTPTPSADPTAPASQTPPVDALATRSTSLAEAFLDLHPDVQPRSEESKFSGGTGAKAQGASKLPIERKRQNLSRALLITTILGTGYFAYDLGKEWESDEERKKFGARSDDLEAIEMAQKDGWEGFIGRIRLRGADQLDVRSSLSLLLSSSSVPELIRKSRDDST